jgi:hypothetical protein
MVQLLFYEPLLVGATCQEKTKQNKYSPFSSCSSWVDDLKYLGGIKMGRRCPGWSGLCGLRAASLVGWGAGKVVRGGRRTCRQSPISGVLGFLPILPAYLLPQQLPISTSNLDVTWASRFKLLSDDSYESSFNHRQNPLFPP